MRRAAALRLSALSAAAVLLAGCFTSEEELVGFWGADTPLQEGVYAHWPTHPDGTEWDRETWRGAVVNQRRRYVSAVEDFPHQDVRFRRIAGDIYLAQLPRDDGVGYGVAWVYQDGAVVSYHQPDCSVLSDTARDEAGIRLDPEGFCQVDDLDQLEAVMGRYLDALGEEIVVHGVYRKMD
ncbi:MAG: hypothetical protein ACFE0P_05045 [Oceanicaulis sp.]